MSERISQFILLCEDTAHERLVRAYMRACGLTKLDRTVLAKVASRMRHGGNVGWVLDRFPEELHACRCRNRKARTLLIVVVDADNLTVEERRRQLLDQLRQAGHGELAHDDPAVLLIAKYNVESWLCALLGQQVTEDDDDCKKRLEAAKEEFRKAAETLFAWTRENARVGPTCIPSLQISLSEWRTIG